MLTISVSLSEDLLLMELQKLLVKPESQVSFQLRRNQQQLSSSAPFNENKGSSHQQDDQEDDGQGGGGVAPLGRALLAELSSVPVRAHTTHAAPLCHTGAVAMATLDGARQRVWRSRILPAVAVRGGGNIWRQILTEPPSRGGVGAWT